MAASIFTFRNIICEKIVKSTFFNCMDSDSNEVPDLQDPQPVSSGVDDEVIEIIPDPRPLNPVKAELVVIIFT